MEKQEIKETLYSKVQELLNANYPYERNFQEYSAEPRRSSKNLATLFPVGCPKVFDIKILKNIIRGCELQAEHLNNFELVVVESSLSGWCIEVRWYETETEVIDRLERKYNQLLARIKENRKKEYETYLALKRIYEK